MGLHGEQGLELVHSLIKKLANQSQGMRRKEDKLGVVKKVPPEPSLTHAFVIDS